MGSETLPSACYILSDESSIPFYSTSNGYNKVTNADIYEDEKMVTFDVVSLFPSISIGLAVSVIQFKWKIAQEHTKSLKTLLIDILSFCITEN